MDLSAMEDTAHAQAYTQDSSTKPIINSDLEQEIVLMCRGWIQILIKLISSNILNMCNYSLHKTPHTNSFKETLIYTAKQI